MLENNVRFRGEFGTSNTLDSSDSAQCTWPIHETFTFSCHQISNIITFRLNQIDRYLYEY